MANELAIYVSICVKLTTRLCGLLLNRPTLLNAMAGLLTTLINIYTARDGS